MAERDVVRPKPRQPLSFPITCECYCHTYADRAPADRHEFHEVACCCTHRYVVPADCPQCISMQESE